MNAHAEPPETHPATRRAKTIDARFRVFHEANPQVYALLVKLAREAREKGHNRISIGMLWEVVRWNRFVSVVDTSSRYELNDNYRSRYARLIMEQEPELDGVFEVRELRSP
jgi:hypothetical protein